MNSQFGGIPVAQAPAAPAPGVGRSQFGGIPVSGTAAPVAGGPVAPASSGDDQEAFGARMGGMFANEVGGAIQQFGTDIQKPGELGTQLLDTANLASSVPVGLAKAGMMIPAAGLQALQPKGHSEGYVPAYTDEHGVHHAATVLSPEDLAAYRDHEKNNPGAPNPYFKESRNRPRPLIRGSTEEIASGLTNAGMDAASMIAPESAARYIPEAAAASKAHVQTLEEIEKYAKSQYKVVDESGMRIAPHAVKTLHEKMEQALKENHFRPALHPDTAEVLKEVKAIADSGKAQSLTDMDQMRQLIKEAEGATKKNDRQKARIMKDELDDFLHPDNLKSEHLTGAPEYPDGPTRPVVVDKKGLEALRNAREAWQRKSKAEMVANVFRKAELRTSGLPVAGYEGALRAEMRKLIENPRTAKRFDPEEQKAIHDLVVGGKLENFLKFMGKFAVRGVDSAGVSIGGGELLGIGGATLPVIGEAAKLGSTAITTSKAKKIDEMVRAGSAGRAAQAQVPKPPRRYPYLVGPASAGQVLGGDQQQ